jgi:hypothetical protein
MKTIPLILASTFLGGVAFADPLKKEYVAADAKWVVHLDVENLLATQLGSFVTREILDKHVAKPIADLKQQFDLDLDWRDIQSLTAYGSDLKQVAKGKGVLIIKSKINLAETLDGVIEKMGVQLGEDQVPLQRIQAEPFTLYSLKSNVFGTAMGNDVFLISRSEERLKRARDVIGGASENLTSSKSFPSLPNKPKGFLVAAVADAFPRGMKLPPPAQGLKNAEGGQIEAGESADHLFLNLAVNTKDSESATQMQQVVQGIVAMAALSQSENRDLQKLVQGTKVSGSEKTVRVNVELPTADVIAKVSDRQKKRRK